MKNKMIAAGLLLALLLTTAACAGEGAGDNDTTAAESTAAEPETTVAETVGDTPTCDALTGEPLELLATISANADIGLRTEDAELSADIPEQLTGLTGLTVEDFADVESAAVSQGMIMSQAHLLALFKCKDADAALTIKQKLHDQFNIRRWVCVIPQQCYVVESGSYVFFAATYDDFAEPLLEAFSELAGGNIGERLDLEGTDSRAAEPELG